MICSRYPLVSLLALLTLTTAANAADKKKQPTPPPPALPDLWQNLPAEWEKREKLRRAISLPRINITIGYKVDRRGIFDNMGTVAALQVTSQITQTEKELKGDATDAVRYSRLSDLYSRAQRPDKSKEAGLKAAALFRMQLEQHPDDVAILLRLTDVLEKPEEAEALVRRVVKDRPNEWHAWLALGNVLVGKSWIEILGDKPCHYSGPESFLQLIRAARPTAERVVAAQQYHCEADACFDRAVHLAPEEAEVYRRRGGSHYCYGLLDSGLRAYKGEKVDSVEFYLGREAEKVLADLRRAVELDRQEYKGIGFVALMETMMDICDRYLRNTSFKPPEKLVDAVSQPTRKQILEDMARLEKGVQDPDKNKASEAAEVLGFLQFLLFADYSAAEKSARRSIELWSDRETAWDLLEQSLVAAKDARKWVDVCRERLEHKDSPCNRLIMAKAYENLDQRDKAEEVVRVGLRREPGDFMLRLALVDLLIMQGDHKNLREARKLLFRMHEDKFSDAGGENRWTNYAFTCGIYCGLLGDRENALKWLKAVQKRQPQYPGLEDALKALEE